MTELEVWLIGTPPQLDAAVAALATTGRHVLPADPDDHPKREPLSGEDHGRYRLYLRIAVTSPTTTARPATPNHRHAGTARQAVIDLDTYRRTG
jgi:hypothetical protein